MKVIMYRNLWQWLLIGRCRNGSIGAELETAAEVREEKKKMCHPGQNNPGIAVIFF